MTRRLIKKLHMYIGLLNFCNILVFGIAGLAATFHWGQGRKPAFIAPVRYESFTAPPGLTDKQIADQILFMCSPRGRTISGQAISICGDTQMLG